jgi:hypothetical protein
LLYSCFWWPHLHYNFNYHLHIHDPWVYHWSFCSDPEPQTFMPNSLLEIFTRCPRGTSNMRSFVV